MKFTLGQEVLLEVIEVLSEGRLLVSIDGHLIRTKTDWAYTPKINEKIRARVRAIDPVQFQALSKFKMGLDIEI